MLLCLDIPATDYPESAVSPAPDDTLVPPQPILPRIASGDRGAVREFLDRYGGLVWSLARRMDSEDPEDAVQEVFVELWRCAERFDPTVASEPTFVAMIARRRLIDRARKRSRRPKESAFVEDVATPGAVGQASEISEEARLARSVMETLNPEQQRVLRLTVIQGLTQEEAAAATGLPLGTVKTYVRRGLMKIHDTIATARRRLELGGARQMTT